MSENIRLRGKYYYYDMMVDGIRYKGTTKTSDKKLAEKIASTIKSDILRQKHELPTIVNYAEDYDFQELWKQYLESQAVAKKTVEIRLTASKHFLPVFADKSVKIITADLIETYRLKRKLEITSLPKNIKKESRKFLSE